MDHAVLTRSQLHKRAEVHQTHDFAGKDHAGLDLGHNALDNLNRAVDHRLVGAADIHGTVVVDIDLHAGLLDDLVDHLTLLADHVADLLGINVDLHDLGSVGA